MSGQRLSVLLVDHRPIMLAGLRALLGAEPGLQIVGEARDGRTALEMVFATPPDIVVLESSTQDMKAAEFVTAALNQWNNCRILVLTVHEDRGMVREFLNLGVSGLVAQGSAAADLVRAIFAVAAGGTYLDPIVAGMVVSELSRRSSRSAADPGRGLSDRELDVLRLIANGHGNKSIASRLAISIKTVETYKARAMEKLGFKSRVDVVRHAACEGWLTET
jgi:DNA-binding NarL/FixJ family response regulator